MVEFTREIQELNEKLKDLEFGNVIHYSSRDKENVKGIKSLYGNSYHILGPAQSPEKDAWEIAFLYKKVPSFLFSNLGGNQNA